MSDALFQVPSAYFLCDTFLYLDRLLNKKLLQPSGNEDKLTLAGREGCKAKRCLGGLRYLWRSSIQGHDPRITDLKSFLLKSPERPRRDERRDAWLESADVSALSFVPYFFWFFVEVHEDSEGEVEQDEVEAAPVEVESEAGPGAAVEVEESEAGASSHTELEEEQQVVQAVSESDAEGCEDSQVPAVADSQMPDSQMPDSQMPDSQMPDSQIPDSQIPDSQMSDTSSVEDQVAAAERAAELEETSIKRSQKHFACSS